MGKTKSETTKTPKVKVPYTHACVFYGGIIKTGYCVVEVTHEAPEVLYANLKKYYGEEEKGFRGKYTRCTKSIDAVTAEINEKLEDKKISDMTFNYNSSEVVKIMKEVCEASKCKTMGVYANEDGDSANKKADDSEDEKPKKKTVTKKTAKSDDDSEDEKPKKKAVAKKASKDDSDSDSEEDEKPKKSTQTKETKDTKKKVVKVESDDEDEQPKKTSKSSKSKEVKDTKEKDTKESKSKSKKAKVDSDDEEDAPITKRSSNKTIVISDDESSEEDN